MTEPNDTLTQLCYDKEEAQAFIRKIMDDLRAKYPKADIRLFEDMTTDAAYGHPVHVFHHIEIKATL
jgi:hypothetical protein